MASLVAKTYSEALYELADEQNELDEIKEQLVEIDSVISKYPDLRKVLTHPQIEKEEKKAMLDKLFKDMNDTLNKFFKILIDKNRINCINEIMQDFITRYNKANNIVVAYISSAVELNEKDLDKIESMLEKKTGKKVEMKFKVDEELIGGIRIRVNDEVLDNTVVNKLKKMKEAVIKAAV